MLVQCTATSLNLRCSVCAPVKFQRAIACPRSPARAARTLHALCKTHQSTCVQPSTNRHSKRRTGTQRLACVCRRTLQDRTARCSSRPTPLGCWRTPACCTAAPAAAQSGQRLCTPTFRGRTWSRRQRTCLTAPGCRCRRARSTPPRGPPRCILAHTAVCCTPAYRGWRSSVWGECIGIDRLTEAVWVAGRACFDCSCPCVTTLWACSDL